MELQKRGSLLKKPVMTPDYQEKVSFTLNADGTYSLNFTNMPGLVFVSYDGVGTFDQLFVHGDFKAEAQRIKIDSAVGELTKYTIESTPVIKTEVATLIPKKSPQEQRDDIIEQAKRDVAELQKKMKSAKANTEGNYTFRQRTTGVDFVVNAEKRTVVALIKGYLFSSQRYEKGIAKCAPTDCFNAHIGKAIALRRAMGLEVPADYLNAPQPTEVRVGDIVTVYDFHNYEVLRVAGDIVTVNCLTDGIEYTCGIHYFSGITDDTRDGANE